MHKYVWKIQYSNSEQIIIIYYLYPDFENNIDYLEYNFKAVELHSEICIIQQKYM